MTDPGPLTRDAEPVVLHLDSPPENGDGYRERLRVPSLSAGSFTARPGYDDQQQPHGEDEIYYVVAGEAVLEIDRTAHPVRAGTLIYVPRGVRHRFTDIASDLDVIVVFSPAPTVAGDAGSPPGRRP